MSNWTVEDIKVDKTNKCLVFRYSCSTRKDVAKAVNFHRQFYDKEEFHPIKVRMVQFMDWMEGGKGIWSAIVTHRDNTLLPTLVS